MFSPIVMASDHAFAPVCTVDSTGDSGVPRDDTDIARVATGIDKPPPLLVVHDPDDPDSLFEMSEKLIGVWAGASLVATRGLGRLAHYRILRHRPAIRAGVDFIGEPTGTAEPRQAGPTCSAFIRRLSRSRSIVSLSVLDLSAPLIVYGTVIRSGG